MLTESLAHSLKVLNIMPALILNAIRLRRLKLFRHATESGGSIRRKRAGRRITLVAELNGEIVGFIDARLEHSNDAMHREMNYCHIAEMAVNSRYQNQGFGGQLLRAAEDWGRQQGAEFASLEYHAANTRASLFYQQNMGYRIASIASNFRILLPSERSSV